MKKIIFLLTLIISFNAYSMELDDLIRDLMRQMHQKPQEQAKKEIVASKASSAKATENICLPSHQQVTVLSNEQVALLYEELVNNPEEYSQKIAANREQLMQRAEQKIAENNSMGIGSKLLLLGGVSICCLVEVCVLGYLASDYIIPGSATAKTFSSILTKTNCAVAALATVITVPGAVGGVQKLWRDRSKVQAKKQNERILNALKKAKN